jgi:FAD/FMN-containing dehydrogenase
MTLRLGLVATALAFGFRHGIDWDHLAALTDLTGAQPSPRRSMRLATLYALGHALVVFVLGLLAITLSERLPAGVDDVMERFVGVTLVALGLWVVVSLVRHGRDFRLRSRWTLLLSGLRRLRHHLRSRGDLDVVGIAHDHEHPVTEVHDHVHEHARVLVGAGTSHAPATHRHPHGHVAAMPPDPFVAAGSGTAFGVGMLHGVGAETPTQVLLFLAAAGAGGTAAGVLLLLCFIAGLVASNTVVALAATFGFVAAGRRFVVYATVSLVTAAFSLVIGTLFVLGQGAVLPAFFGG